MNEAKNNPYRYITRTLVIAIFTGIAAALIVALFGFCLDKMLEFVASLGRRAWVAMPFAAIALTITVFGTSYILPAVTGSSIAFILFKGNALYRYYSGVTPQESTGNDG